MNNPKRFLTWLLHCAGKKGPFYPAFDIGIWIIPLGLIVYDGRIFRTGTQQGQGGQPEKDEKVDLGIRRQVEDARRKGFAGSDKGDASSQGKADVD